MSAEPEVIRVGVEAREMAAKKDGSKIKKTNRPTIAINSSALRESGLFQSGGPVEIKSPLSCLKTRKSFHVGARIQRELASLQKDTQSSEGPRSPVQKKSFHFRANSGRLQPFFQKASAESLESIGALAQLKKAQERKGDLANPLVLIDEKRPALKSQWDQLFSHRGWRSSKDLINLMKEGIPEEHRGEIWKVFLRIESLKTHYPNDYYNSLLALAGKEDIVDIDKDISRTMPHHPLFKSEKGKEMLKRVLYAYALRNPDTVGYCQGMNYVAAGLLTVLEEEDAFWALCVLTEMRLGYYTATMISLLVDQSVLSRLITFKVPDVGRHMERLGVTVFQYTTSWFLCLFMKGVLEFKTAIKFWDYLFCYGDEMLFHMALEVLVARRMEILRIKEMDEMATFVLHAMQHHFDDVTFAKILMDIGTLTDMIERLRSYYQNMLSKQLRLQRCDSIALADRYEFSGPDEVLHLWKIFTAPAPWDILMTESQAEVGWFAEALHSACFPNEPDKFCAHGLLSGFMHRLFDILDSNNTCNVTFKKFLKITHALRYGTERERMKLAFEFYDFDGDKMISLSDLQIGITIIANMIEGAPTKADARKRVKLARMMMRTAFSEEKLVCKTFDHGPFGLQLNTEGLYPSVRKVIDESTKKMGIKRGWELLTINGTSFEGFNEDQIYEAMRRIRFPAIARFRVRMFKDCKTKGRSQEWDGEGKKTRLNFGQFTKVARMHRRTEVLFRLHGAVYEWAEIDDDDESVEQGAGAASLAAAVSQVRGAPRPGRVTAGRYKRRGGSAGKQRKKSTFTRCARNKNAGSFIALQMF